MDAEDRERKKAWRAGERAAAKKAFPLSDPDMESLFAHVNRVVDREGCDHTLRVTDVWIREHGVARDRVVGWLRENGGYCDCEVVANAQNYWDQNR